MKKWTTLEQARTSDGQTISLHEHDGSYSIRVDGAELMSTRQHASEEKIAELACAHLKGKRGARVLIGGLGLGFTLRATLSAVEADCKIIVAEISGAVIAWNKNPAYPLAADAMADRRVTMAERDVDEVIREARGIFDSIILDVDNGPEALTKAANSRLYGPAGLQAARTALRPGGCAAFWSAAPNPAFEKLLVRAGFAMTVERCRAHSTSGGWRTIFLGRVK